MQLLLLGCTGFVGRELVPALLEANHQLILVSRRLARGYEAERADGRVKAAVFQYLAMNCCPTFFGDGLTGKVHDGIGGG